MNNNYITYIRRAYHSGSWYSDNLTELNQSLSQFLADATNEMQNSGSEDGRGLPRGIIAPHAGYAYSGPTAAFAYLALKESLEKDRKIKTILVLHPSHHVYLDGCAISGASTIETPIKNLQVDQTLRTELLKNGDFSLMNRRTDEAEHSGEMQYPFIAKVMSDVEISETCSHVGESLSAATNVVKVLPIMIGSLSNAKEEKFGKVLAPFVSRPDIFTVVSSDFCHWGKRFGYFPKPPASNTNICKRFTSSSGPLKQEIYQYIEYLDKMGMDHITMQQPGAFAAYLKEYKNTICGRHPIGVWLHAIKTNNDTGMELYDLRFVKYAQSSQVLSDRESSVSYASAVANKIVQ